ncbi:MAG: hypothetical protein C4560_02565 [Nitrospiraceae bacterium]|nr:MAG: hypothetical protein C4560_02565 [Nitrospiraceae bacterium]
MDSIWKDAEIISQYTRANAMEDGYLIDVTETAKEAGFLYPVAVTRAVWADYVVPDEKARQYGQDEAGRLWDILWMLKYAIKRGGGGSTLLFEVRMVMKEKSMRVVKLKSMCHPGDTVEPVITIMTPDED